MTKKIENKNVKSKTKIENKKISKKNVVKKTKEIQKEIYNPNKIESKWVKIWDKQKLFKTKIDLKKKKMHVLDMFPYPSGEGLHTGHAKIFGASDVFTRFKRMQGYNVLHAQGYDAFGLPAEQYALKNKVNPKISTKKNTDNFERQMKLVGLSYDWERTVNTTDPEFYKWTQFIFKQLYKAGLCHESFEPINWCPSCKTGLANEDLEDGKCERCSSVVEKKPIRQWVIKITDYAEKLLSGLDEVAWKENIKDMQRNWIGKSEGAEIDFSLSVKNTKKKILIGTRNEAKFNMIRNAMPLLEGIEFVSLNDVNVDDSQLVEGNDFEEDARMKSEFYFEKTGIPTISSDNVLWLEKWKKNNGVMLHMRKEANPKSERATDEEVIIFLQKWLEKVGGSSKANFIYALAFTDERGTKHFSSKARDYVLQKNKINNYAKGYPTESMLIDLKTGEYKANQKSEVAYEDLKRDLEKNKNWFMGDYKFTIFTTRPDTLFGCTYCVFAPEGKMVKDLLEKNLIENKDEVEKYIEEAKNKTEIERSAEGKEKTGVELKGIKAINPANQKQVPIYIADYVLGNYGTGAIMAVPAHDERDYEFAKKYNIEVVSVVAKIIGEKTEYKEEVDKVFIVIKKDDQVLVLNNENKPSLVNRSIDSKESLLDAIKKELVENLGIVSFKVFKFLGLNYSKNTLNYGIEIEVENEKVVIAENGNGYIWKNTSEAISELRKNNLLEQLDILENANSKKEIIFSDAGYLVNSRQFSGMESQVAGREIVKFVGGKMVTKYKLRDWVFARQRYWGEPFPIVFDENHKAFVVADKELPVVLPNVKSYEPTGTGESPLANIKSFTDVYGFINKDGEFESYKGKVTKEILKKGKIKLFKRETNTMPQWAGSSWYWLRYMDPKNKKALVDKKVEKYWGQVDVYLGGMEHATRHLIYGRFWNRFLYDKKIISTKEPFNRLEAVGLVLGEGGVKMSKRLGNVINPDDIVKQFGADTLRLYIAFAASYHDSFAWDTKAIVGPRRFIEKVWALQYKTTKKRNENKKIETLLHQTIKKVGEDYEKLSFNTAISQMMIFVNNIEEEIDIEFYKILLKLLAPVCPFFTEEIWKNLGEKKSVHISSWPKYDAKKTIENTVKLPIQINGKLRGTISIDINEGEESVIEKVKSTDVYKNWIEGKEIKKIIYLSGRILNIVV